MNKSMGLLASLQASSSLFQVLRREGLGRTGCVGPGVVMAPGTPLTYPASRLNQVRHAGQGAEHGQGQTVRQTDSLGQVRHAEQEAEHGQGWTVRQTDRQSGVW